MSVVETEGLTERERVGDWREIQLLDLGFSPQEAELIADTLPDHRSYREFKALIDAGCPPSLAMEILL